MSRPATIPGQVMRLQSGFFTVATAQGTITCVLRGRLKRRSTPGDVISVGDTVLISLLPEGSGAIEEIKPRRSEVVRLDPTPRGFFRQILLANADQMVMVFACANPEPHLRMLDRFLVIAEKQGLPPLIVANKVDLVGLERAREMFSPYPPLGYPVLFTSARTGAGIDELHQQLEGRLSALAGPSGVGKSSLLNAIQPELGLAVREISAATAKGKHTTVVRQMFPLAGGGFVADLPGIRSLMLWDTQPEELDGYFPELRGLVDQCQFNDCSHSHEPGCAVIQAVKDGRVHPLRYESYLRLRYGGDAPLPNDEETE
jgi:ribosome biogenesis GTPase / thiamine phosphate phosphatase